MRRAAGLALLFTLAYPAAADEHYLVMGIGLATCAQFAKAYEDSPKAAESFWFNWGQGYMSGLNVNQQRTTGKSQDLRAWSIDDQKKTIRNYCDIHPLETYEYAVLYLYQQLPPATVKEH
jgi:hypothetical protein